MQQSTTCIKNQRAVSCLLMLLLFLTPVQSALLVVPNELPSILSLVYSNIPPIKKGTDSRLGFGFRLGEHADFQVLLELGPQKETRPIGDQENSNDNSFSKRHVNKQQQLQVQEELTSSERFAANWLEKWSKNVNASKTKISPKRKTSKPPSAKKPLDMPIMPQLPNQSLRQLLLLYKMATSTTPANMVTSTESSAVVGEINVTTRLHERLKTFKPLAPVEELQVLQPKPNGNEKTKAEITKELMDVTINE